MQGAKIWFAQWEEVGPFRTDSASYVFGDERPTPNVNYGAGIDISPAVRDYLRLRSLGFVVRFVALAAAGLLLLFGTAMAISLGIKTPLDYSVFSASAGALLLAICQIRKAGGNI